MSPKQALKIAAVVLVTVAVVNRVEPVKKIVYNM